MWPFDPPDPPDLPDLPAPPDLPDRLTRLTCLACPTCLTYRRGEPGSGWMIALARAPLNSVVSPAFLPGAGSSRAAGGLCHLNASVATSPTMLAIAASVVSPGSGTVSTPPAHTAE